MKLLFLTSNLFKLETARLALEPMGFLVEPVDLNIPEIQADSNQEIARHGAMHAARDLNQPVMREDHGFYLNAFPGWPGPYMAHAERIIPPEDALRLIGDKDRSGYFEMALAYATPGGDVIEFSFQLACVVAVSTRLGAKDFGWDSIICLENEERALSEYPPEDRYQFFTRNFIDLARYLGRNTSVA